MAAHSTLEPERIEAAIRAYHDASESGAYVYRTVALLPVGAQDVVYAMDAQSAAANDAALRVAFPAAKVRIDRAAVGEWEPVDSEEASEA